MATVTLTGWLASTRALPVYGGIALSEQALQDLAARLLEMPYLNIQHGDTVYIPVTWRVVEVRRRDDGELAIYAEYEVDEEDWENVGGDVLGGFSFALIDEIRPIPAAGDLPPIGISADAGHFDRETLIEAWSDLEGEFRVGGGELFQFAAIVPAKVVVSIFRETLAALGAAAAVDALKHGLSRLLHSRTGEPSVFTFDYRDSEREVRGELQTDNAEVLLRAIETLQQISEAPSRHARYIDGSGWEVDDTTPANQGIESARLSDGNGPDASEPET